MIYLIFMTLRKRKKEPVFVNDRLFFVRSNYLSNMVSSAKGIGGRGTWPEVCILSREQLKCFTFYNNKDNPNIPKCLISEIYRDISYFYAGYI